MPGGGKTVLVVEDDRATAHLVRLYLERDGYRVVESHDGGEGLETATRIQPDLVILDVMLPHLEGTELCRRLRERSNTPVIFLTARTTERDRISGFEMGADDYVTKPFSPGELVARARAVLRRFDSVEHPAGAVELQRGNLRINLRHRTVIDGTSPVQLTPKEYRLLCVLAQEPGRVYSREMLVDLALGDHYAGLERTVDAHIKNLRKKIEPDPAHPRYIETVYGTGYRMRPELRE